MGTRWVRWTPATARPTTNNAEAKIRELADELVLLEVPGGGLSTLQKAKMQALEAAARVVRNWGVHAIPDIIRQLTPEFDEHVEAYTEAFAKLPEDITAETLVSAGADAVTAFGDAQREVGYLNKIDGWSAQTATLLGITPKEQEVVIRILQPESMPQLAQLDAARARQADPALQLINPVFYTAARDGIPFGINSARQAAALRTRLESPPLQKL
jgi:hypothetical protein